MSETRATVLAHTANPAWPAAKICTLEIYAPRIILAEINTHRVIAKSAQSSRAIPTAKRIESLQFEFYMPEFARNQPGMQAAEQLSPEEQAYAERVWMQHKDDACTTAHLLSAGGLVHKQWANRVLEPFCYFYGVITATEWENFFQLRLSKNAQPEFEELAHAIDVAMKASTPRVSDYHTPYVDDEVREKVGSFDDRFSVSAARCARVSYKNHDGTTFDVAKDLELCADLTAKGHFSPFDQPAFADKVRVVTRLVTRGSTFDRLWENPGEHRQYWGWIPYRVRIEQAKGLVLRRDSYAPLVAASPVTQPR